MDYKEYIKEKLEELNLDELEGMLDYSGGTFEDFSISGITESLITGESLFDSKEFMQNLTDLFLLEVKGSLVLGVEIITVCIVIGLLKSMSSSFGEKAVSKMAAMTASCIVIALCLSNFRQTYILCGEAVGNMTYTMQLLFPIVIPLLVSMGGLSSGSVLSPVILGIITIFNTFMMKVILPALFFSSIFILINGLTEKDYVNKLALFLRGAATFATGLCVTIFSGLSVIQSLATKSADGFLINTARYSINNFVPIIGGFAADSVDMVLKCIAVIKNAVSIFGVIIIISLMIIPIVKLLSIAVIYKITAIIAEPIGMESISDCLNEMGNSVITMVVVLFLTALMFLIFITILIGIGGAAI